MIRLCFPFVGDTIGGSHISSLLLITALDKTEYDPLIVVFQEGVFSAYLKENGIAYELLSEHSHVIEGTLWSEAMGMLRCAPRLIRFLKKKCISIVHTNDLRMHLTWGLAVRLAGAKHIWHQRTANPARKIALYSKLSSSVIMISRFCRRKCSPYMARHAQVIYNPFIHTEPRGNSNDLKRTLAMKFDLPDQFQVIGFVGNLIEQKRPLVFISAAAELISKYNGTLVFLMFGALRPPMAERVRQAIEELDLSRHVFLMGSQIPIHPWLSLCDVILAPAVNEGFGRVLIESMVAETPVIASDSGGHSEIIRPGENGYLAPKDDPLSLTEQTLWLLTHQGEMDRVVKQAKLEVMNTFTVERHVKEVTRIYKKLSAS